MSTIKRFDIEVFVDDSVFPNDIGCSNIYCEDGEYVKWIDVERIEAENKRLREALEFYANKRNWARNPGGQLVLFCADTNGPYKAFMALKEAINES